MAFSRMRVRGLVTLSVDRCRSKFRDHGWRRPKYSNLFFGARCFLFWKGGLPPASTNDACSYIIRREIQKVSVNQASSIPRSQVLCKGIHACIHMANGYPRGRSTWLKASKKTLKCPCNRWVLVWNPDTPKEIVQFVHEVSSFCRNTLYSFAQAMWVTWWYHAKFLHFQSSFCSDF